MKRFLLVAILAFAGMTFSPPATVTAQTITVGTTTDTVRPNTTKSQKLAVGSHNVGLSVQYLCHYLTDTITGVVSVWGSLDGTTYVPYPGADSVTITAHTDCSKIWLLNTRPNGNPFNFIDIRTRCPSNTTNSTGKAKLTTKALTY